MEDDIGTEQVQNADATNPPIDAAIEERARRMGWRPKEEFRGPEDQWTDAKTFVDRGEAALPVLRERYRALDDRFVNMERAFGSTREELQNLHKTNTEMREVLNEFRTRAAKAEEISYARARAELESRMAVAVEQADRGGYDRAKGELDKINAMERESAERKPPPQQAPPERQAQPQGQTPVQIDPIIAQWVEENPWFKTDPSMAAYATATFQRLRNERPGGNVRDHLDEVRADVRNRFSEKFDNPRRAAAPAVGAPTQAALSPAKKGPPPFDKWPQEAKEGFRRFKSMMPDYKEDEYAKIYFAGEDQ